MDQRTTFVYDTSQATPEAEKLVRKLREIEAEIKDLNSAFGRGAIHLDQYQRQLKALESQAARTQGALDRMDGAHGAGGRGGRGRFGARLQDAARLADDLQYVGEMGLRPILNNVVEIAPALGVAMIAVDQFIRHWKDLRDVIPEGYFKRVLDDLILDPKGEKIRKEVAAEDAAYEKAKEIGDPANKKAAADFVAAIQENLPGGMGALTGRVAAGYMTEIRKLGGEMSGATAEETAVRNLKKAFEGDAEAIDFLTRNLGGGMSEKVREYMRGMAEDPEYEKMNALLDQDNALARDRRMRREAEARVADREAKEKERDSAQAEARERQRMGGLARDFLLDRPGAEGQARGLYLHERAGGKSAEEAERSLAEKIALAMEGAGVRADVAKEQGAEFAKSVRRGMEGEAFAAADGGRRAWLDRVGRSGTTFRGSGLADQLVNAGADVGKQQLDTQKMMAEQLAMLNRKFERAQFPAVVAR